MLFLTGV